MDAEALKAMFEAEKIDAVIHCAALKAVGESVQKPLEYYRNNITGTLTLMEVMQQVGVKNMAIRRQCRSQRTAQKDSARTRMDGPNP